MYKLPMVGETIGNIMVTVKKVKPKRIYLDYLTHIKIDIYDKDSKIFIDLDIEDILNPIALIVRNSLRYKTPYGSYDRRLKKRWVGKNPHHSPKVI